MKQKALFFICLLIIIGCGVSYDPFFVHASDTCYVDKDSDDDGDGSSDEPYQKINDALDDDCTRIIVSAGKYSENIVIGKDVSVEGKGRDTVTIAGAVTMKDGAKLSGVTVSGKSGIDVEKDAGVEIEDVTIVDASIGISTIASNGKLTVRDTKIYDGGKGIYLQAGNAVKMSGCEIYDNDEEGIDIRSNVDGSITDNEIHDNGESGIEVILGKADLVISGNKIKKNKASGISAQYYKGTGKSGAVKVKSNTVTDNKQYGMNCKTPSGGNPGKDFWEATLNMSSNKLSGNKDGDFAQNCSLSDATIADASMTQKQKEEAARKAMEDQKQVEAAAKKQQEMKTQQQLEEEEKQRLAEEEEQRKIQEKKEKNIQLQNTAQTAISSMQTAYEADIAAVEQIQKRNAFVMFLIGPRMDEIEAIAERSSIYERELAVAQEAVAGMDDQTNRHVLQTQVDDLKRKTEEVHVFAAQQRKEFSLFGWMFD